jgi:sarcosine oxidase subunit beta
VNVAIYTDGTRPGLEVLAADAIEPLNLPSLEPIGVRSSWWGYYEMSPDHNAIVGAAEHPAGLFYATGFSGHGFQQGPVIGEHLAELALGYEPTFDLEPFSLTRFAQGRERIEHSLV